MQLLTDPEQEYEKNNELKRDDVRSLIEWAEKEAHLPKINGKTKLILLMLFIAEKCSVCMCVCVAISAVHCANISQSGDYSEGCLKTKQFTVETILF